MMKQDPEGLSASQEDYLEAILLLEQKHGRGRVRDLSARLSVHKSTVTAALKMLTEKGLIEYEPYGQIRLTAGGRKAAERVLRRHALLKRFLEEVMLLDADTAEENACRMEHVMDRAVLERFEQFGVYLDMVEGGPALLAGFRPWMEQSP